MNTFYLTLEEASALLPWEWLKLFGYGEWTGDPNATVFECPQDHEGNEAEYTVTIKRRGEPNMSVDLKRKVWYHGSVDRVGKTTVIARWAMGDGFVYLGYLGNGDRRALDFVCLYGDHIRVETYYGIQILCRLMSDTKTPVFFEIHGDSMRILWNRPCAIKNVPHATWGSLCRAYNLLGVPYFVENGIPNVFPEVVSTL